MKTGQLALHFFCSSSTVDYPPMQDPASFNLDAVKRQIQALRGKRHAEHHYQIGPS
jgi:hypothetical protein